MHGLGVTRAVAGSVPPEVVPALRALTQLGDVWFLTAFVVACYWVGADRVMKDHRDGARLVAVALVGFAAVTTLKVVVAHPRPPVELVHADGNSLPSGHATGTAAVYLGFALLATWRSRRERVGLAVGLVTLVSATRVALGVHYLLDVVAGAVLGTLVVAAVLPLTRERVGVGFGTASVVAAVGAVVTGGAGDPTAVAGVALGAAVAWALLKRGDVALTRPSWSAVLVGGVVVAALVGGALSLSLGPVGTAITSVSAGAVVAALPAIQNVSR